MKNLLIIILAVFLVGCGKPQEVKDMQLMQASMGGNIESVKMLLESGANVNFKDSSGRTSLHKASGLAVTMFSSGEHKEITELLIRNGANANAKTNSGETPLDIAVQSGNILIAEFLRKNGGKHGLIVWAVGRGGDIESVKKFINAGVDVNTKLAGTGSTLLDLAIGDQQEEIADLLRKHGGKTSKELSTTPKKGDKPNKMLIQESTTPKKGDKPNKMPIQESTTHKKGNKPNKIAIQEAVLIGNIEALKEYLIDDSEVNFSDKDGWTLLHFAAYGGHNEIVELLIEKGVNLNEESIKGKTPIDLAKGNIKKDTADLLRKHGGKTAKELKAEQK